jgi:NADH dehydrogenase
MRGSAPLPFSYKDPGSLATIGRNAAIAHVWGLSLRGFVAWLIWLAVHITRLIGYRNRLLVLFSWGLDYFFKERAVRLIVRGGD